MRIEFIKKVDDDRILPYLTPRTSTYFGDDIRKPKLTRTFGYDLSDYVENEVHDFEYDLEGLEKFFVGQLGEVFTSRKNNVNLVSNNELWVDPDRFSLVLNVGEYCGPIMGDMSTHGDRRLKFKNHKLSGGIFGFFQSSIPVYQEEPSVNVFGSVTYEYREDIDPRNVIEVLRSQGYTLKVIPTKQEELEVL